MKSFIIPEAEIIRFVKKDIITESTCKCVNCGACPSGDDCKCNTFCTADSNGDNEPD